MKTTIKILLLTLTVFALSMVVPVHSVAQLPLDTGIISTPLDTNQVAHVIANYINKELQSHLITIPLLGIKMTWYALLGTLLWLLQMITWLIPGVTPFHKTLIKWWGWLNEFANNKGKGGV